MQEMQVQSLGQENPLEKDMETHSSISCLENPINSGAWQATVLESDVTEQLSTRVPSLCLSFRFLVCFSAFIFLGAHSAKSSPLLRRSWIILIWNTYLEFKKKYSKRKRKCPVNVCKNIQSH